MSVLHSLSLFSTSIVFVCAWVNFGVIVSFGVVECKICKFCAIWQINYELNKHYISRGQRLKFNNFGFIFVDHSINQVNTRIPDVHYCNHINKNSNGFARNASHLFSSVADMIFYFSHIWNNLITMTFLIPFLPPRRLQILNLKSVFLYVA